MFLSFTSKEEQAKEEEKEAKQKKNKQKKRKISKRKRSTAEKQKSNEKRCNFSFMHAFYSKISSFFFYFGIFSCFFFMFFHVFSCLFSQIFHHFLNFSSFVLNFFIYVIFFHFFANHQFYMLYALYDFIRARTIAFKPMVILSDREDKHFSSFLNQINSKHFNET